MRRKCRQHHGHPAGEVGDAQAADAQHPFRRPPDLQGHHQPEVSERVTLRRGSSEI